MVSKELLEAHESLNKRRELYKDETKLGYIIRIIGAIIFIGSFIYWLLFADIATKTPSLIAIIFGVILIVVGSKIIDRALTPRLSIDEEAYLNVYDSLKYIDEFLKERIGWLRIKATKKLAKVEKEITDVEMADTNGKPFLIWEALIKEENKNIHLLKQNFNERLLPSIIQSNEEELKKTYSIIEEFGKFLLNPTILELQDLNKSMLELNPISKKETFVNAFLKRPYTHHIFIFIIFVIIGIFVYYLGTNILGIQKDNAFIAGTALFGTLSGGYIAIIIAKKT